MKVVRWVGAVALALGQSSVSAKAEAPWLPAQTPPWVSSPHANEPNYVPQWLIQPPQENPITTIVVVSPAARTLATAPRGLKSLGPRYFIRTAQVGPAKRGEAYDVRRRN